jgi:hypothetical protein
MTFTDDDLKRFRQASDDGIYPYSEPSFKALLARLKAAEKLIKHLDYTGCEENENCKWLKTWRKAAGK